MYKLREYFHRIYKKIKNSENKTCEKAQIILILQEEIYSFIIML